MKSVINICLIIFLHVFSMETSSKTGEGVTDVFMYLAARVKGIPPSTPVRRPPPPKQGFFSKFFG
jgi:hypothetical protein